METQLSVFNDTIKEDGELIFVKPVCVFFKIDYDNQVDKIKNDPILSTCAVKKPFKTLFGDNRPRFCLSKKGFIRWIQLINPATLPDEMRYQFLQYQADIFDFFYGTAELEDEIKTLRNKKHIINGAQTKLTWEKRLINKALERALDNRYQPTLPL